MKILHTYCLNYNLGDHALGFGVKRILRELLPVDFIAETNIQGQRFDSYYIDVINRNFDALVIGGGGIIHGAHWPNGWFWLIDREMISKIEIPFIVYAVGYNYFENEQDLPERGVLHLNETVARARLFSVRNDGSHARLLKRTGIDAKVLADPGFWVSRGGQPDRPADVPEPYVIIQLADDKPACRYAGGETRKRFISELRAAVVELAQNHHVLMAPHVYADIAISQEVIQGIKNASVWDFSRFAFDNVRSALAYYAHADLVVAMRGHGQILAMAYGVPVISLINHPKHLGLMEDFGIKQYALSINPSFCAGDLNKAIRNALTNASSLSKSIASRLDTYWQDTVHAFSKIDWGRHSQSVISDPSLQS